jgi:ankyrin repeat protein
MFLKSTYQYDILVNLCENNGLKNIFELINIFKIIEEKCKSMIGKINYLYVQDIFNKICMTKKKSIKIDKWYNFIHSLNKERENILIHSIKKQYNSFFIRFLIEDLKMNIEEKINYRTALSYAVELKNHVVVEILIKNNALVNTSDEFGNNLFYYLFLENDSNKENDTFLTCQELVKGNIDCSSLDLNCNEPIDYAINNKDLHLIFFLMIL